MNIRKSDYALLKEAIEDTAARITTEGLKKFMHESGWKVDDVVFRHTLFWAIEPRRRQDLVTRLSYLTYLEFDIALVVILGEVEFVKEL